MDLNISRGDEALELFHDDGFRLQWKQLFDTCRWSTVFQDVDYLTIWHRNYANEYELLLIHETEKSGKLVGLLPLARCKKTEKLVAAGEHLAEYQTWLATEENGESFARKAFDKLAEEFPRGRIQLIFLAPETPMKWFDEKWGSQACLQTIPRSLVDLNGQNTSAKSLRKRGNKTRIRQLKKQGELRFDTVKSPSEFGLLFDEIEDFSRLRLSAIHNVRPVTDHNRKGFHLELMRDSDLVYPTLLRVGGKVASAQVCFRNKDEMLLCLTSMSPFFAKQSPSKIHLLMLGRELTKTNYKKFDLSPGNGYKQRFATENLESYSLTIFFKKRDYLRHAVNRKVRAAVRHSLDRLNIKRNRVFCLADRFVHKVRSVRFSTIPGTILKNLGRKAYNREECRMYSYEIRNVDQDNIEDVMNVDSVSDLNKYRPTESWQQTTSQFHQRVLKNFENGIHSYTLSDEDTLLHHGWMIDRQCISRVHEVDQEFRLPQNTAVLFDYYTHPKARGQGLYQQSILQGLKDAANAPGTKQAFIGVMADNAASRHVIEKLGFKYEGSLFRETKFGFVRKWQTWEKESKISEFNAVVEEAYAT